MNWCSHASDILGIAAQIPWRHHTWLARRIHSTNLLHGPGMLRSVLHMARSDNALASFGSHRAGYSDGVNHQHRLWKDRGRPKGEICWSVSISFCLLPEACWRPLFPILTVNFSGINWVLHHIPYIFYLLLTNSTSFGGLRCFAGLCPEYARNNTKWSIYKNGETWI